jgi:hypothetical protein
LHHVGNNWRRGNDDSETFIVNETNLQTLGLWAGVVIVIIGAVATPIIASLRRENDSLREDLKDFKRSVENDTRLAIDAVNKAMDKAEVAAKEKRGEDLLRIERLEDIYDGMNEVEPRKRP